MRAPLAALLASLTVAAACTSPPTEEELELREEALAWSQGYASIPEAEARPSPPRPEPEPALKILRNPDRYDGPPRIVVGPYRRWGRPGAALCPFEVQALGFPAVTVEGDRIVSAVAEAVSASDGEDETMHVRWHDVDADTVSEDVLIFDGEADWEQDRKWHPHCRDLWEEARAQAEAANQQLAERDWRRLERLEISIYDPHTWDFVEDDRAALMARPARERALELLHQHGTAVVRVPGLRVLEKAEVDWWGGFDHSCDSDPHLLGAWGDRRSGAVAVELDHQSGACLCYTPTYTRTLRWSEETFAALEREAEAQAQD